MTSSNTVVPLRQPHVVDDPLTAVLRDGARRLLAQAVEAEAEAFLATKARGLVVAPELATGEDRGEHALDRVGRLQVVPVLGPRFSPRTAGSR